MTTGLKLVDTRRIINCRVRLPIRVHRRKGLEIFPCAWNSNSDRVLMSFRLKVSLPLQPAALGNPGNPWTRGKGEPQMARLPDGSGIFCRRRTKLSRPTDSRTFQRAPLDRARRRHKLPITK